MLGIFLCAISEAKNCVDAILKYFSNLYKIP